MSFLCAVDLLLTVNVCLSFLAINRREVSGEGSVEMLVVNSLNGFLKP